jgi:hypothetical protein
MIARRSSRQPRSLICTHLARPAHSITTTRCILSYPSGATPLAGPAPPPGSWRETRHASQHARRPWTPFEQSSGCPFLAPAVMMPHIRGRPTDGMVVVDRRMIALGRKRKCAKARCMPGRDYREDDTARASRRNGDLASEQRWLSMTSEIQGIARGYFYKRR